MTKLRPVVNIPLDDNVIVHTHAEVINNINSINYISGEIDLNNIDIDYIIDGDTVFTGDKNFYGDFTVYGSFYALSAIIINTEEFALSSNFIDLNNNWTSGAPIEDAGIRVIRGDEASSEFRWDETNNYWAAGIVGSLDRVIVSGDLNTVFTGLTDTPNTYTSGRIPYTNAGATALTDSANLRFDGSNLTVSGTVNDTYISKSKYQVAHGFAVGNAIYNNAGTWTKAQANNANTLGIAIVTSVEDVDNFTYKCTGKAIINSHGFTEGQYLLVSETLSGELTETAPIGLHEYSNTLGYVLDADTIFIFPWRPTQALTRSNDINFTSIDADYVVLDTDEFILADALSGAINITFPTPTVDYAGFTCGVKKIDTSSNPVNILTISGNIDGVSGTIGKSITSPYNVLNPACDGTDYWIR